MVEISRAAEIGGVEIVELLAELNHFYGEQLGGIRAEQAQVVHERPLRPPTPARLFSLGTRTQ